ncbi:ComEC/Rec2 family competence protein [Rhodococcoides kyotonense]|uniref:Competence protein ComEC n=1 Tax=Rhodococcoides kyotonense TaxID=398843 RepID=A0A239HHJ3_9NOCA|nr:ComEC/Rec2 family competence protein [Rhodococcus kyotonensis]SNS80800.1 competence protein ComEC [Rhodococcus kyotonensis]
MTEPTIRPYDLRLVPAAAAGWMSTIIGLLFGSVVAGVVAVISLGAAVLLVLSVVRSRGVGAGLIALAVSGACYSGAAAVHSSSVESSPVTAAAAQKAWVSAAVVVREDPRRVRYGGPPTVSVRADLTQIDIGGVPIHHGGRVLVLAPADGWEHMVPGQSVTLRGRLSPPDRADLTLAVIRVQGAPLLVEEPGPIGSAADAVRRDLAAAASEALPSDRAGLLPGLVVGDVSALPDDVESDFKAAGLTHLNAVSGANFSILLGAVLLLTRWIGIGPRPTAAVCAVVLLSFVVIARPSPSVLRAAVMGGVGLLALVTGRRRQAVPALCAAVLGLLAWWPELAVDFGFALSVLATAGLVVLAPVWVDWLRRHGWGRASAEIVAVAAAAHAVTAPVVAAMAGTFSVVGVLANVLVAPVVAPITVIGAIAALIAQVSLLPAALVVKLASAPLWWLIAVAHWAASTPGGALAVPDGLAGAGLVLAVTMVVLGALRVRWLRWVCGVLSAAAILVWIGAAML